MKSAGRRGDSRLARVMTAIVMLLTIATGAWAQSVTTLADATAADVGKVVCAAGHLQTVGLKEKMSALRAEI